MKKTFLHIAVCLLIVFLYACGSDRLDVDVSEIETKPLTVLRLEHDLFGIKERDFEMGSKKIKDKYGIFYEHYLINFIARRGTADTAYKAAVLGFVNDHDVRGAYNYITRLYPNEKIESIAKQIDVCARRFKYYFNGRTLPTRLVTCTTGWNYAFAYHDSTLFVSLDMYLGDTAVYYQMLRYSRYQTYKMNEAYILPDVARGWLLTEFDNADAENKLLNHCIFYGKLYYATNALLPHTHDSLLIGYTGSQLQYCKTYEKNLWGYFAEKNRLYENNMNTIRELISDGPFTGAISKECPPRIGMWVGWQIVKSYMKNNTGVQLKELMADHDALKILNKSRYRP